MTSKVTTAVLYAQQCDQKRRHRFYCLNFLWQMKTKFMPVYIYIRFRKEKLILNKNRKVNFLFRNLSIF